MHKQLLLLLLMLFSGFSKAQGVKFAALQKKFVSNYCSCLQSNPRLSSKTILYNKTDTCILSFMSKYGEEFENFVGEFTFDNGMTGYEKGRKMGKFLVYDSVDELVAQCPFYVASLKGYIKEESKALGISAEKIDTALTMFKQLELEIENDEQRNLLYPALGFMYYMKVDYPKALEYFEKANRLNKTTVNKGFIEVIKQYDLKK